MKITVENLSKRFNREWIFRKFNFVFEPGIPYAVTGPNGSGKSTLLQVLWGQMPPSSGTIQYEAHSTVKADSIYRHVSIATPYMDLIDEFTLQEQLAFHFRLKTSRDNLSIDDILDRMYMLPAKNKAIADLSSGMRQRTKLAIALFTQADILFLDEPGTNLDDRAFSWYLEELNKLPASCLVLIASNQASEYPQEARKINIMDYK